MSDIQPYRIAISDAGLSDLKSRLSGARLPDELDGAEWDLGTPLADVKRLAQHWAVNFDWRRAEARLNELPHFTTPISVEGFETLNVHFIHRRSPRPDAIPLIFVHGWPGSFYEGTKIVEPLAEGTGEGGAPAFHVVVPSLPSFGFSEGTKKRGFSIAQHAEVMNKLMLKLGYDQYVTQGGDWGWAITRAMSYFYPAHARAQHVNLGMGSPPSLLRHPLLAVESMVKPWTQREKEGLARSKWFRQEGRGYNQVQSTRPQTIGYALADSPVALLSWIYEKLHDWTDSYPWTDDEVCTWMSIYWFSTAGPAASVRLYYENMHENTSAAGGSAIGGGQNLWNEMAKYQNVKMGLGHFPKDVIALPAVWSRQMGNVVHEKQHPKGGHFPAWENPEAIIGDLRAMFGEKGGARDVLKTSKL
ncbi:microsomal epoxide hydrolase [Truncatella angustata]|uniref:Microsomal epoxide hydrolase n=1 Tax=Truncatella angustata TaxID=152316 RepID=A0A9P8UNQ0_9PEZI|nr:microsomal epoxide hydrolase [Truncatella angustata]KAH6655636.1 microsomal epoxide hydrolase [Truncatella angustata]